MVTVSLCGGTGNQLWQRAFGYALEALGNEVVFDRSPLDNDETRAYTLNHWNTEVIFGPRVGRVITEPDLLYHPEFLKKYDEDVTINGYFQSVNYLTGVEDTILKAFTLRESLDDKSCEVAREMLHSPSCSLHVRRTDNLSARGLAFHGLGSEEYWARAIQEIYKRTPDAKFFVFSDDIAWCKEQPFFTGARFVDHNSTGVEVDTEYGLHKTFNGTEHRDLFLMSRCKHAIMATSTFGFWSAWLGPHQRGGTIVRPAQWFIGSYNEMSRDMFPETWLAR